MRPLTRAAAAVVAAGLASAAYQRAADAADRRRFPPPGQLADIGGRRIHLLAMGEGTPAVVIIPSLGGNVLEWVRVQRATASKTTVVVVDRAGIGWSDPPPLGKLTLDSMADDLHAALTAAGITPPYIIAGHSLGGIVARRFHARHPRRRGDVAGRFQSRGPVAAVRLAGRHRFAAAVRGAVPVAHPGRPPYRRIPGRISAVSQASLARETVPEYAGAARAITLSSRLRRIAVREMLLASRLWGRPEDLGSLPLAVISTANRSRDWWPAWTQMQDELAVLSSDTVHMTAVRPGTTCTSTSRCSSRWRSATS